MTGNSLEVRISHLTGGRAREVLADNPVVFLPMGSQEDQGPHFPMGDYLLPEEIARIAAVRSHEQGVPAYVMPVIPYGGDDFFASALGGAVLRPSTMTAVLMDVVCTLIDTGLTRIVLLNGHSGNVAPILDTIREVRRTRDVVVPSLYLWEAAYGLLPQIVGAEQAALRSGHGADPLGSVGLHLMPQLIETDRMRQPAPIRPEPWLDLPSTNLGRVRLNGIDLTIWTDYAKIYNDGMSAADPNLCDAKTGEILTDRLVNTVVELARLMTQAGSEQRHPSP
jgi:creatinine amidohydrolase